MHLPPARLGHVNVEVEHGNGGVTTAAGGQHLELRFGRDGNRDGLGLAHAATARSSSK